MAGKERAVLGIYANYSSVENAVEVLKEAGFRNGDISVLFPQRAGSKDFAHTKGTRVPEGAAAGAGTGALLGGALGCWWASALWRYQAWIPLSPPVRSWRVGGAVGGTTGALIGMGIPERQAKHYEVRVKEGGILLSAHSDNSDWAKRAKGILERTGAQDISSTGEADYIRSDKPLPRTLRAAWGQHSMPESASTQQP